MRSAVLLLVGSLVACSAVSPSDLAAFFSSSKGLSMSSSDASKLAQAEAPKLTKCDITVHTLQALRDTLFATDSLDFPIVTIRSVLLPLAYQQVNTDDLTALFKTLYATDGVDLSKSDSQSKAQELAKKKVDAPTLQALFRALYATSGVDLPKKDAQTQALELALGGANATQLKLAYAGFIKFKSKADALQAAIPEAILAGFQGLARRHAPDTEPYTAAEFQGYFGSNWVSTWESAPQEQRVAKDQKAYTIGDFIEYFKDPWYWTQAKTATQKRIADDGELYTMADFYKYYKSQWQQKWMAAAVVPCAECALSEQKAPSEETVVV